jgi:hypothetical protein
MVSLFRFRIKLSLAFRDAGSSRPVNSVSMAKHMGPLILTTATPAGRAPLESAYIVSGEGMAHLDQNSQAAFE